MGPVVPSVSTDTDRMAANNKENFSPTKITMMIGGILMIFTGTIDFVVEKSINRNISYSPTNSPVNIARDGYRAREVVYIITGLLAILTSWTRKKLFFVLTLVSCIITIVIANVIRLKFEAEFQYNNALKADYGKYYGENYDYEMIRSEVNLIFLRGIHFSLQANPRFTDPLSVYQAKSKHIQQLTMASTEIIGVLLSIILAAVSGSAVCRRKQGSEV